MTAAIHFNKSSPVLDFAAEELRHFLGEIPADWQFHLDIDPQMSAYSFAVNVQSKELYLSGSDATCVLHAVYTMLEKIGLCFEITGPRWRHPANLDALNGWSEQIQPVVNQRGIRQHINFPMDISGYPLDEALEYIRNLARLRLNHITFHSYHNQWYEVPSQNSTEYAGHFFYGQRHDIPDNPVIQKVVRNQKTFCIPAIEPIFDEIEARSKAAIAWLQAVINEAKRVGLQVQFSFELREQNMDVSLAAVDSILKTYPQIDILEMITQETGGWGHAIPGEELRAIAVRYFGDDILNDPNIAPYLIDGKVDLYQLVREIGHYIELYQTLKARGDKLPKLSIGIYCVVPEHHKVLLAIMRRYIPAEISTTYLLDHGNRAVADNARAMEMTPNDWQRATMYSWIEFDGTMYIQQNALTGIYQLIQLARQTNDDSPVNAISLNHWRTAENRTCARYSAVALIDGISPEAFYSDYVTSLGIASPQIYAEAMQIIDDADSQARYDLPNVGFCYVGVWRHDVGLGYFGKWRADKLAEVRRHYENAAEKLRVCAAETTSADGLSYLNFLDNRLDCTITYLHGVEKAVELQPICNNKMPDDLTQKEKSRVVEICDEALAVMDAYMALHAQAIVDRGCEGTLVSFYYTPPDVLKQIKTYYTGTPSEAEKNNLGTEAPPAPIQWE